MFRKWISKCFCVDSCVKHEENNETVCLIPANIKKLIIVETGAKLPDITDKWKVIYFIDQANNTSCSILGGCIDFNIQNDRDKDVCDVSENNCDEGGCVISGDGYYHP